MAPKRKQSIRTRQTSPTGVRTGYKIRNDKVERFLITGAYAGQLRELFGRHEYEELRQLAAEAATIEARDGQRVLILPGTMGSKLGTDGLFGIFQDTIWFDPLDIAAGKLLDMTVPSTPPVKAIGVMLFAYLKLHLRLKGAGFDASFFDYDWRDDILGNADLLADEILADPSNELVLVGHSQGGLLARAALDLIVNNDLVVSRLIMLATPNHGSFAPLETMRGTYGLVKTLAVLDLVNDAETLARDVFSTYPALCQMLPPPGHIGGLNLFRTAGWPSVGPRPRSNLLTASADLANSLAPADNRFFNIIGINRDTPINVVRTDPEFVYTYSTDGDGTVSRKMCELAGCTTYYTGTTHGSMGNSNEVASAVIDIITSGSTTGLSQQATLRSKSTRTVRESDLRVRLSAPLTLSDLDDTDRRRAIDKFVSPTE